MYVHHPLLHQLSLTSPSVRGVRLYCLLRTLSLFLNVNESHKSCSNTRNVYITSPLFFLNRWLLYTYSKGHKRWTGQMYSFSFALTHTTLVKPSDPGKVSKTRPRGQSPWLEFGSIIITTSPSLRLCWGGNHFFLVLRMGRGSFRQRFHTWPISCCTRCHR